MNTTSSPANLMSIPVVASKNEYPEWITSRWGEWHMGHSLSNTMMKRFGHDISIDGDPRHLTPWKFETAAIALRHGRLGVHSEVELNITEAAADGHDSDGSTVLSSTAFAKAISIWQSRLASLVQVFPESEIFLAHGVTYDGRLTLNAFTPLGNPNDGCYQSPYAEADRIESLDIALNEMVIVQRQ